MLGRGQAWSAWSGHSQGVWGLPARVTRRPGDKVLHARPQAESPPQSGPLGGKRPLLSQPLQCRGTDRGLGVTPDVSATPLLVPTWPYSGRV